MNVKYRTITAPTVIRRKFPHSSATSARDLGKNEPFFLRAGAEAYRLDIPDAEVRFLDTGHFALETDAAEVAVTIRSFLERSIPKSSP